MEGKFIVFDGLDGAGKSTAIRLVKGLLARNSVPPKKILLTAEPTKGFFGKKIRQMLAEKKDPMSDGEEFLCLYVLDRKHHLKKEILPALHKGKIVLCDRYKYSTLVYQSVQGVSPDVVVKIHEKMRVPDLVFVFDLPVSAALSRLEKSRKSKDVFEKKAFLENAREKFLHLKHFFPAEKIIIVDASAPIQTVAKTVFAQIKKII